MPIIFYLLAALVALSAIAAMSLRNLVHCALCLAVTFVGLAAFYLRLDAAFIGWAQILVYVGAVAILIVFTVMLTRGGAEDRRTGGLGMAITGLVVAGLVFAAIAMAIYGGLPETPAPPQAPSAAVREIGRSMMGRFVLPLEILGLLLTAALIGAVLIALPEKSTAKHEPPKS